MSKNIVWHVPEDKPLNGLIICEDIFGNFYQDVITDSFDHFISTIIRWGYIYEKNIDSHNTDITEQLKSIKESFERFRDEIEKLNQNLNAISGCRENRGHQSSDSNNEDTSSRKRDRIFSDLYDPLIRGTNEENSFKPKSVSNFVIESQADAIERDFNKKDRYE